MKLPTQVIFFVRNQESMINIFGIFWCEKICLFLENQLKINFGDFFKFSAGKNISFSWKPIENQFLAIFFNFRREKFCLFLENQCYDLVFA
jgi:hypothetical protein